MKSKILLISIHLVFVIYLIGCYTIVEKKYTGPPEYKFDGKIIGVWRQTVHGFEKETDSLFKEWSQKIMLRTYTNGTYTITSENNSFAQIGGKYRILKDTIFIWSNKCIEKVGKYLYSGSNCILSLKIIWDECDSERLFKGIPLFEGEWHNARCAEL
ncbi:MAG: hypothetical protein NTX22_10205 [Ignavibacteriales bacterium]|nr:hypothetical protein [Ignavibacteriales bacterium]